MAECEVNSPVNRKGSKVGSGQPRLPARVPILHVDALTHIAAAVTWCACRPQRRAAR